MGGYGSERDERDHTRGVRTGASIKASLTSGGKPVLLNGWRWYLLPPGIVGTAQEDGHRHRA